MATKRLRAVAVTINGGRDMPIPVQFPVPLNFAFRVDVQECPEVDHRIMEQTVSWDPSSQTIQNRYLVARTALVTILENEQNGPHTVIDF